MLYQAVASLEIILVDSTKINYNVLNITLLLLNSCLKKRKDQIYSQAAGMNTGKHTYTDIQYNSTLSNAILINHTPFNQEWCELNTDSFK